MTMMALTAWSPTGAAVVYWDGNGFTLRKASAISYKYWESLNRAAQIERAEKLKVVPLPMSWPVAKITEYWLTIGSQSDPQTVTEPGGPRRQANPKHTKKTTTKRPARTTQHQYRVLVRKPNTRKSEPVTFWSGSDAKALNYCNGLLMRKNPPNSQWSKLVRTDKTRRTFDKPAKKAASGPKRQGAAG